MNGWMIDRDYFEGNNAESRVGYGQTDSGQVADEANTIFGRSITVRTDLKATDIDNPVRIRLVDEDDEVHYGGCISREWLDGEEHLAFAPLEFATADTGATIMEYRDGNDWKML